MNQFGFHTITFKIYYGFKGELNVDIKVMTFNIHHGKGMDKRIDLARVAEVIDQSDADLIGLNEVDSYFSKRSFFENQAEWLANELKMDHAFSPSVSKKSKGMAEARQFGNALLSRYPITGMKTHLFKLPGMEGRSMLEASIEADGLPLQVGVAHLSLNPLLHHRQTSFIVQYFHNNPDPVILMGDWNMKPGSKGWRNLTETFQDAWHETGNGPGYTYSSLRPRMRLDYIFTTRNLEIVKAEVFTKIPVASDHLPLLATIIPAT